MNILAWVSIAGDGAYLSPPPHYFMVECHDIIPTKYLKDQQNNERNIAGLEYYTEVRKKKVHLAISCVMSENNFFCVGGGGGGGAKPMTKYQPY